ncbi:hypothetical protein LOK49_LG04G00672 [Camellia lanceoleosa]|uniref:Uncharacterized protein n=1 Tax=Camellia lanceoleosa TaxID=1840588 RepID=A0ACC0I2Y0_9ERIC|nr:hypothetical protein LOK49_LG04G00672 [Camellia lanceoleosa]
MASSSTQNTNLTLKPMLDLGQIQEQKKLMILGQRLVSMREGFKGWRRCSRQ